MSAEPYSNGSTAPVEETRVWCRFECEEDLEDPAVHVVADGPDGHGELTIDLDGGLDVSVDGERT